MNNGKITSVVLHYKRPFNIPEIIQGIRNQSIASELWIWDNSGCCPVTNMGIDVYIKSSRNFLCQPRVLLGGMAESEYIWTQDDDWKVIDPLLFEKLIALSKKYPDYMLCFNGKTSEMIRADFKKSGEAYDKFNFINDGETAFCNTGFSFFRTEILNRLPLNPYNNSTRTVTREEYKYGDDMYISSFLKTRAAGCIRQGIKLLNEGAHALSLNASRADHYRIRNELTKRFFIDEGITEGKK